jgi:hypothetical protein
MKLGGACFLLFYSLFPIWKTASEITLKDNFLHVHKSCNSLIAVWGIKYECLCRDVMKICAGTADLIHVLDIY